MSATSIGGKCTAFRNGQIESHPILIVSAISARDRGMGHITCASLAPLR